MPLRTCVYLHFFGGPVFNSFGYLPKSGISGSYGTSVWNLSRSHQTVSGLYHFMFPPAVYEGSNFSPDLFYFPFLDYSHAGGYEVLFYDSFFPSGIKEDGLGV